MISIDVNTSKPYKVHIGSGLLEKSSEFLAEKFTPGKLLVLTDETVSELYFSKLNEKLAQAGWTVYEYVIKPGEESKSMENAEKLVGFMAENCFSRKDILIALGGGVVGDLGGFAASMYMRGIEYVQMPTTVLAAVDSSVGGKTAVNLPQGKNLAGAFYQPAMVICDLDCFKTLPQEIYSEGLAEAIKCGIIEDRGLFEMLETGAFDIETVVGRSVACKTRYVEKDELDNGERVVLNLGHTIAHAVEKLSEFEFLHGEAVAIGLLAMARTTGNQRLAERIRACLLINGLPTGCGIPAEEIADEIVHDKKASGDSIRMVFPKRIGETEVYDVPLDKAKQLIINGLEEG